MANYRYGEYEGGPDPLAPPYDVRGALDDMGEEILGGGTPAEALRELLRRGWQGHRGLDDLLRRVRERSRELRGRGRLDGMLEQARALLDTAVGQERAELFPDPSDDARLREAELDALPSDTSRAIRQLADYDWRSQAARETFERLRDLLRREVLDSQFRGMKEALENPDPAAMQRVKDMLADLRAMLDADTRGEHTPEDFAQFMAEYGDMFPDNPQNLEELVDSLVRRMMAAERLLASLSDEQREELASLMSQAMEDAGLAAEMAALADALAGRRPELGRPQRGVRMSGEQPLGLGDATSAVAELADLADLESALNQDYAGASLDDIDEEAIHRALGRQAVDDIEALRQIERELERQGYLTKSGGNLELTPKAVRRLGDTALRRVFAGLESSARGGDHEQHDAGQAGELTGATREWEFGDEQPIDVPSTVRSALLRSPGGATPLSTPRQRGETPLSPPSPGEPAQTAGPRASSPTGLGTTQGVILAQWTRHAISEVTVHDLATGDRLGALDLPGIGTVGALAERPEGGHEAWFSYPDYTTPPTVLRYNAGTGLLDTYATAPGHTERPFISASQHTYASRDGTPVRLVLIEGADAGRGRTGRSEIRSTILYGYGGFDISMTPAYSPSILAWVEAGGAYAIAALR